MTNDYSAVIFAGGKSSRMGKDKSLLPFGTYSTLSEFQQERLKPWFEKVYLSAKNNKFDFHCECIEDKEGVSSPLVGLLSILESIDENEVFVLSVDAPFVDKSVIEKILNSNDPSYDVIVAKSPSGVQPLCGLYKKSILPLIYRQLEANDHKLQALLELAQTNYVTFNDDRPFTNLNHPYEYEKALNSLF
jgi:molybdopterin-guanine dinucleotide biosynthesis protein A